MRALTLALLAALLIACGGSGGSGGTGTGGTNTTGNPPNPFTGTYHGSCNAYRHDPGGWVLMGSLSDSFGNVGSGSVAACSFFPGTGSTYTLTGHILSDGSVSGTALGTVQGSGQASLNAGHLSMSLTFDHIPPYRYDYEMTKQ